MVTQEFAAQIQPIRANMSSMMIMPMAKASFGPPVILFMFNHLLSVSITIATIHIAIATITMAKSSKNVKGSPSIGAIK